MVMGFPYHDEIEKTALWAQLFIWLYDLAQIAEDHGQRIDFADDIAPQSRAKNITELLRKVRGAFCHMRGPDRQIGGMKSGSVMAGQVGMMVNGVRVANPYDDDSALVIGVHVLLINRHILRFISEAQTLLMKADPPV